MAGHPQIPESQLENICKSIADAVEHKKLSVLFSQCGIAECGGKPKWERMLLALSARQRQDQCGNNVLSFLCALLHPSHFEGHQTEFDEFRKRVNFQLAFMGMQINEKVKLIKITAATTITEAQQRANELHTELAHRKVHADVLRFCKAEYLQDNYFHCVLEATKSAAQKIRDRTGLSSDGSILVDQALSVNTAILAINTLQTESERSEQKGFCNLLKGVFGTFRNVTAHAPKIYWAVDRTEALDALTILSYVHRRLDDSAVIPRFTP